VVRSFFVLVNEVLSAFPGSRFGLQHLIDNLCCRDGLTCLSGKTRAQDELLKRHYNYSSSCGFQALPQKGNGVSDV
jgi:hypothetical protein